MSRDFCGSMEEIAASDLGTKKMVQAGLEYHKVLHPAARQHVRALRALSGRLLEVEVCIGGAASGHGYRDIFGNAGGILITHKSNQAAIGGSLIQSFRMVTGQVYFARARGACKRYFCSDYVEIVLGLL